MSGALARLVIVDDGAVAYEELRAVALRWLKVRRRLVEAGAELGPLEYVDAALGAALRAERARHAAEAKPA